jgi:signal transduction histidine kinase
VAELREFAGEPDETRRSVDLNRAISNTVAVSRASWEPHVDIELSLSDAVPEVRGSPQAVRQALLSLLTNAVEVQSGGAGLWPASSGQSRRRGRVRIASRPLDGGAALTVSDDGPGIEPGDEERIFDPLLSGGTSGEGGSGLFVAYSIIVGQCGGKLRCESAAGRGAAFHAWLPPGAPSR